MQTGPDVARYVHVTGDHDGVRAAWERLGFEPVHGWSRGDAVRSTLFRAGPAFVELVDRASVQEQARPADAALVAG